MQWIKLSNDSRSFCVDDEDFVRVNAHSWYLSQKQDSILGYVFGKTVSVVRYILNIEDSEIHTDHWNRNIFNNCRSNLRSCTLQQNNYNRKKKGGSSKYKGVTHYKKVICKPWRAKLCKNGVDVYCEFFSSEEEAARAYDKAARKYFGEFAYLNFPDEK